MEGKKTFIPLHLSKHTKKNKGAIEQHVSRKAVQGESARIYRFSFVFFCRSITATAKKEKRESQDGCISPYGRSITNLYRKFMRITAAW
jgi:hypothetical protein